MKFARVRPRPHGADGPPLGRDGPPPDESPYTAAPGPTADLASSLRGGGTWGWRLRFADGAREGRFEEQYAQRGRVRFRILFAIGALASAGDLGWAMSFPDSRTHSDVYLRGAILGWMALLCAASFTPFYARLRPHRAFMFTLTGLLTTYALFCARRASGPYWIASYPPYYDQLAPATAIAVYLFGHVPLRYSTGVLPFLAALSLAGDFVGAATAPPELRRRGLLVAVSIQVLLANLTALVIHAAVRYEAEARRCFLLTEAVEHVREGAVAHATAASAALHNLLPDPAVGCAAAPRCTPAPPQTSTGPSSARPSPQGVPLSPLEAPVPLLPPQDHPLSATFSARVPAARARVAHRWSAALVLATTLALAQGATLSESEAMAWDVALGALGKPAGMAARSFAAGAFFNQSGRILFMAVGGTTSSGDSDEIWIHNLEARTWNLAPPPAKAPLAGSATQCAFELGTSYVYCGGGSYPRSYNFWRISSALTSGPELLPSLPTDYEPTTRSGHCLTAFKGSVWVAAGYDSWRSYRNDLLRYTIATRSWSTEIANGNSQMAARAFCGCARSGSRLYISGGGPQPWEESNKQIPDIYFVDLADGVERRFVHFTTWPVYPNNVYPRTVSSGHVLGICYGLVMLVPRRRTDFLDFPVKMFTEDGSEFFSAREGTLGNAFPAYDGLASLQDTVSNDSCLLVTLGGFSYFEYPTRVATHEASTFLLQVKIPGSNAFIPELLDMRGYNRGTGPMSGRRRAAAALYYEKGVRKLAVVGGEGAGGLKDIWSMHVESGVWQASSSATPSGGEGIRCAWDGFLTIYCLHSVPVTDAAYDSDDENCEFFSATGGWGTEVFHMKGYLSPISATVAYAAATRSYGPVSVGLSPADGQTPPMPELRLSLDDDVVYIYASGGSFNISALPANLNGGSYRFRVYNVYGDGDSTSSFQISSWNLMEVQYPTAGAQAEVNTSMSIVWTSSLWSFEASVYLLPSNQNQVLSWSGQFLGNFSVSEQGGSADLFIPKETTPGHFVIQLVDEAQATRSSQLFPFIVATPPDAMWEPELRSGSGEDGTQVTIQLRYWRGQNVSTVEANCTNDAPPSYANNFTITCSASIVSMSGLASTAASSQSLEISAAPPLAPSVLSAAAANATVASLRAGFSAGQNASAIELTCSGFGGPYRRTAAVSDADAGGVDFAIAVAASYASNYTVSCSVTVASASGLRSAAAVQSFVVPAEIPTPPAIAEAGAVNSTLLHLRATFTVGQSVSTVEAACTGRGGPYAAIAAVSSAAAAAGEVMIGVPVSLAYLNYTVDCTLVAESAAGVRVVGGWATAMIPAAPPLAPSVLSAAAANATVASLRAGFSAGQNASAIELTCSGFGGPYRRTAAVSDADAGGVDFAIAVAASYASNYTVSCSVTVASASGLRSAAAVQSFVVPAEIPTPPAIAEAGAVNSTLLHLRATFTVGQSVSTVEAACTGRGGPYAAIAAVSSAAAAAGEVMIGVPVSLAYLNYTVDCTLVAESAAGVRVVGGWATAMIPAAPPLAPSVLFAAAANATVALLRAGFSAGQNASAIELTCSGFGGPYRRTAAVSDADAGGVDFAIAVAASYASNYTVSCSVTVASASGLRSAAAVQSFVVPAEIPTPPAIAEAGAVNSTLLHLRATFTVGQSVSTVEAACTGRGGPYAAIAAVSSAAAAAGEVMIGVPVSLAYLNYTVDCTLVAESAAGVRVVGGWATAMIPAAPPLAPSVLFAAAANATVALLRAGFSAGQNASAIELTCTGFGGPYRRTAAVSDADAGGVDFAIAVAASYASNYTVSCSVTVASASGLRSAAAVQSFVVPAEIPTPPAIAEAGAVNSTLLHLRATFTVGQSVSTVEAACTGRGGPYAAIAAVSSAAAAAGEVMIGVPVSLAYLNYTVDCTLVAESAAGVRVAGGSATSTIPAAPPLAPSVLSAVAANATVASLRAGFSAGQNASAIELTCSGFGGPYRRTAAVSDADAGGVDFAIAVAASYASNYTVSCSVTVASASGLRSAAAVQSFVVPAERPSTSTFHSADALNATMVQFAVAFATDQNITALRVNCTGFGGVMPLEYFYSSNPPQS
eukprot:tig00021462_g21581.t1